MLQDEAGGLIRPSDDARGPGSRAGPPPACGREGSPSAGRPPRIAPPAARRRALGWSASRAAASSPTAGVGRGGTLAQKRLLRRLLLAALVVLAPAAAAADPCEAAALTAADAHGVPREVMRAVLRVETGSGKGAERGGWPWSANADGRSYRFEGLQDALAFAAGPVARAAGNVDLGCFQISERWHGEKFSGPREMLDPMRNALYAARLLRGHHERLGDWTLAAGAYHSMTEAVAVRYRARFRRELAALGPVSPPAEAVARADPPAGPRPLLSGSGRRAAPIFTRVAGLGGGVAADAPAPDARAVEPLPSHPPLERVAPLVQRPSPLRSGARPLLAGQGGGAGSLVPASQATGPLLGRGWGS